MAAAVIMAGLSQGQRTVHLAVPCSCMHPAMPRRLLVTVTVIEPGMARQPQRLP